MKITASKLRTLLIVGENLNIEFKRASDGPKADTFESVCAFLNKAGGDLLLGVDDDGTVVGLPPKSIDAMIRNFIKVMNDPNLFEPTMQLYPERIVYQRKHLIYVHVPESPEVHRFKGATYVRVHESDVRVKGTEPLAQRFIRKQHVFTEQRVFPYVTKKDMRLDLLPRIKEMTRDGHPWRRMSADAIFKSAKLLGVDAESGKKGFKAAAMLLLGSDDCIGDVFPAYKTDALLRRVNVDRYDDRVTVSTNLLDSYDQLWAFGEKHLLDKFYLEDGMRVSLRGKILREMVGNLLVHREFSSARYARLIIERDRMYTENANRAFRYGRITPKNLEPEPKNPIIANFFHQIRLADELGSGVRNLYHYVKIYSNAEPVFDEDDVFRLIVPLNDEYSADRAFEGELSQTGTAQKTTQKSNEELDPNRQPVGLAVGLGVGLGSFVLNEVTANPQVKMSEIALKYHVSKRTVERIFGKLSQNGRIVRVGGKRFGHWEVIG
ncbi:MAG: putative DNA binding domain-containing protein [Kiritimatiellae bacterium]|nr:putative DNA binding domain-containing protein [Kiritimatiellia bacterium]